MSMVIANNMAALSTLNTLSGNTSSLTKNLKKTASGQKINSAGDDASGYSISEKMRVQIRGLNQDKNNVQNGASLLRVAEGAIQSQINLMRTVKERVIQASNDTNTDEDRRIIQKEIDQCYEEINDIAAETTYNGKMLLIGNAVEKDFPSWVVLDHAEKVEGSDSLKLIPDNFASLDGQEGPFDTFGKDTDPVPYDGYKLTYGNPNTDLVGGSAQPTVNFHDADPNTPRKITIDFSVEGATVSALNHKSFNVETPSSRDITVILTTGTGENYRSQVGRDNVVVNISGCTSLDDVAAKVKDTLAGNSIIKSYYEVANNGKNLTLTTKSDGTDVNTGSYTAAGASLVGGSDTTTVGGSLGSPEVPGLAGAAATGLVPSSQYLTGGANEVSHLEEDGGHWKYGIPGDDDSREWVKDYKKVIDSPAKSASTTINGISGVTSGSGVTLIGSSTYYLTFEDGSSGLRRTHPSSTNPKAPYYYTIGKDFTGKVSLAGMTLEFSGGNLTLTASPGAGGNSYGVTDGFLAIPKKDAVPPVPGTPVTTPYTATTTLGADAFSIENATNGTKAHWDIDLSAYNSTDSDKAEELIQAYLGKIIKTSGYSTSYEFIDTGSANKLDGIVKGSELNTTIDLNRVRTLVRGGESTSKAFYTAVNEKVTFASPLYLDPDDSTSDVIGVKFMASVYGTKGNDQTMSVSEGELRQYTIDFSGIKGMPESLHQKGFRFYCATDPAQWVNVYMYNGEDSLDLNKPASGTSELDIKTLMVDISSVSNSKELVALLDEKLGDYLKNDYRHNFLLAADVDNSKLTIYDKRRYTVLDKPYYPNKQEKGAKIADGIMDNVIQEHRYLYVNDLYIQHTTKANKNIHLEIPQTTIDHILGFKVGTFQASDYNVLTQDMRERLLGWDGPPKVQGIIDAGLEYLTDANTLIGAQLKHMELAERNIVTEHENVTSSESVIRDADMAMAMTEYTKYNVLAQAAQSMLAQANQNSSNVLSLLQ